MQYPNPFPSCIVTPSRIQDGNGLLLWIACRFACDSVGVEMGRVEKSALVPRWQALITAVSPA